jgi:choloylglycine hydrolase
MQLNASKCPGPDERPPLSEASLVQYVLDTCGSVQEVIDAVSLLRLFQNECASHYLVADDSGECATIEFLDGRFVFHAGESLPVKALANAPYAAGIAFIERGVVPVDNPGKSVERVAAAADKIKSFRPDRGVSPVDYALEVLTETVVAPKKWWSNLFDEPYTRWNIVFDIRRRVVHFRNVESPNVKQLSLDSFDLSCQAPLLMLDVNAELEGSIDGYFGPYDHDINLKTFRTFCDKWGIEVSEENAVELIRLFESFACAPDAR